MSKHRDTVTCNYELKLKKKKVLLTNCFLGISAFILHIVNVLFSNICWLMVLETILYNAFNFFFFLPRYCFGIRQYDTIFSIRMEVISS